MDNIQFAPTHLQDGLNDLISMTSSLIRADCRILEWKVEGSVVSMLLVLGEKYGRREWREYEFEPLPVMPIDADPPVVNYTTKTRRSLKYLLPIEHPIPQGFWLESALILEAEWKSAQQDRE